MPLNSLPTLRRWFAPWLLTAVGLFALVVVQGGAPLELWLPMLASMLAVLALAGALAGLGVWGLTTLGRLPMGSRGSYAAALLAGVLVAFLPPAPMIGNHVASALLFAGLAVVSAWRVAPAAGAAAGASAPLELTRAT